MFIDEIHRFNKLQQDALLPYVENGTIILIGATTENPYFEVNKALISRFYKNRRQYIKKNSRYIKWRCKNSFKWFRNSSINNKYEFRWIYTYNR